MSELDDSKAYAMSRIEEQDYIARVFRRPVHTLFPPDHVPLRNIKYEPHIKHACIGIALTLTESIRMTMAHLIAEAAGHLDDIKRFAPAEEHLKAIVHANKLHGIAQILAGDREHEIYSPDDELAETECSGITPSP